MKQEVFYFSRKSLGFFVIVKTKSKCFIWQFESQTWAEMWHGFKLGTAKKLTKKQFLEVSEGVECKQPIY
ncbi:MAG: hypothetical protein R3Y36_03695 [Spirochaetales bacterium]